LIRFACPHCGEYLELRYQFKPISEIDFGAEVSPPWRTTPIGDLEISTRAFNSLQLDFPTAGHIDDATDTDILAMPNVGLKTLTEVRNEIERLKKEFIEDAQSA
jgi:DNA-directed RNA polymerase alpha subunit